MTGQYPHRHGVVTNHTPWDNRNITFLELLKTAGYETAFIGKWHMPGKGLPKLRGLDHFISFTKEGGQGVYYNCPLIIDGVETELVIGLGGIGSVLYFVNQELQR